MGRRITYDAIASVVWTDSKSNGSASSPQDFSSTAIGTAAPNREVFVAVFSGVASAVTVGGVSASVVEATSSDILTLWRASVPTGTTATVSVTFTGGGGRLLISVWAAYNLQSTTPFDSVNGTSSSTPVTNHSVTIDTAAGGILIAAAAALINSGDGGPTWTGSTLRDSEILDTGSVDYVLSAANSENTAAATGVTVQTTWSPAVGSVRMIAVTYV